ncbi:MAG: cyclase family protein, partial [Halobacteriales archaeon]|nr:cyclase family protein [Halobacteriales archaeon]
MVELIDLSGYVEADQPVFPGNTRTQFFVTGTHEETGLAWLKELPEETGATRRKLRARRAGDDEEHPIVRTVIVSEHGPTHVDALTHLDPTKEESIDMMDLDWFYGPAIGLDVTVTYPDDYITVTVLE